MILDFKIKLALELILIMLINQSCASFKQLPNNIENSAQIIGTYNNDCDSTDHWTDLKLWKLIDSKSSIEEDSFKVRIEISEKNQLIAYLISDSTTISEKLIKGKFKEDNCYYTKRVFYIVPIFPLLWWYVNRQDRIYVIEETLIYENTHNTGGVVIFMAGGNYGNYNWMFKKKKY